MSLLDLLKKVKVGGMVGGGGSANGGAAPWRSHSKPRPGREQPSSERSKLSAPDKGKGKARETARRPKAASSVSRSGRADGAAAVRRHQDPTFPAVDTWRRRIGRIYAEWQSPDPTVCPGLGRIAALLICNGDAPSPGPYSNLGKEAAFFRWHVATPHLEIECAATPL